MLAHVPGCASCALFAAGRAYGLLLAAIRDPSPVIFLEPAPIRLVKQDVADDGVALPLDVCFTLRGRRRRRRSSRGGAMTATY